MVQGDFGRAMVRAAGFAVGVLALSALGGCLADGPSGGPLGVNFAGNAADKADKTAAAEPASDSRKDERGARVIKASAEDRRIASREMAAAAESGTISGSAALDRLIEAHAAKNDIPPALAYAVVRVESRYNPHAHGVGVYGLSQIKPATARSLGFSGPTAALYDPNVNLTYGMRYLKGAWEAGGHDICRTAMKYKGGHRVTHMSRAAARYCSQIKAQMAAINEQRGTLVAGAPAKRKSLIQTLVAAVTPSPSEAAEPQAAVAAKPDKAQASSKTRARATAARPHRSAEKPQLTVAAAYAPARARSMPQPDDAGTALLHEEAAQGHAASAPRESAAASRPAAEQKPGQAAAHDTADAADPLAARMAGFSDDDVTPLLRGGASAAR
ncbi:transglycosylase SLT domain-containing protein [Jiella sp. M17.18]|uniref:transglycosylase SLT domain-containing protein n=1 Tax=Jiella sp. M17.18 TaxID=3234247 RepID=UPI0034DEF177